MLSKAIILIIIGSVGGSPKVDALGPFATASDCQAMARTLMAAAMLNKVVVTGLCVQTPFVFKDRQS